MWKQYRAEELATYEAFNRDSELVWSWYNWRRSIIKQKQPNPAHYACVELEKKYDHGFNIITQNVDSLHRLAGSKNIIEIHGNIFEVKCLGCGIIYVETNDLDNSPKCKDCSNLLRPNVVWFGEILDPKNLERTYEILNSSDLFFIIGSSSVVYPAASFASIAKNNGAYVVEINLEKTPNSNLVDISIQGKAGEILPKLLGCI